MNYISTTLCRKSDAARALERRRADAGQLHVASLMKKMGIEPRAYEKPVPLFVSKSIIAAAFFKSHITSD